MPILTTYKIFINHKRGNIIFLSQRHCPSPSSARTSLSVEEPVTNTQAQAHLDHETSVLLAKERGERGGRGSCWRRPGAVRGWRCSVLPCQRWGTSWGWTTRARGSLGQTEMLVRARKMEIKNISLKQDLVNCLANLVALGPGHLDNREGRHWTSHTGLFLQEVDEGAGNTLIYRRLRCAHLPEQVGEIR